MVSRGRVAETMRAGDRPGERRLLRRASPLWVHAEELSMSTAKSAAAATPSLSIRVDGDNPDHHLFQNRGTWWIHYTEHRGNKKERKRQSLRTRDVVEARSGRDALFARMRAGGASLAEDAAPGATPSAAGPAVANAAPLADPARARSQLLRPLGLEGWDELEPVVLASLCAEAPLLLVGPHGSAKSFALERLAASLGLRFRAYNASLLHFDDLVGIPLPDESGKGLRYVSTPTSIWDAEVVFIDELNRTRPELQNKIFPIVHERRVQGVSLTALRHRWAAMNPPVREETRPGEANYLGAEPLDPALADRFAFVVEAPSWGELSTAQQKRVLQGSLRQGGQPLADVKPFVERARRWFLLLREAAPARLVDYFVALEQQRRSAGAVPFSTRRMAMLLQNALAVQAARAALAEVAGGEVAVRTVDWETSVWLAFLHGSPTLAETGTLDRAVMRAFHRQAWAVCGLAEGDPWRELLTIADPVERALRAVALGLVVTDEQLGQLVVDGVESVAVPAHRDATALALYLAVHRERALPAIAVESLAQRIARVLAPVQRDVTLPTAQAGLAREVGQLEAEGTGNPARDAYVRNLLEALLPDGYAGTSPREVRDRFVRLWDRLQLGLRLEVAA